MYVYVLYIDIKCIACLLQAANLARVKLRYREQLGLRMAISPFDGVSSVNPGTVLPGLVIKLWTYGLPVPPKPAPPLTAGAKLQTNSQPTA